MEWETVIGLEIHAQLRTRSKIFSSASTAYGAEPNTQACAVDLGLPGVLPVVNAEAIRMAAKFGLATGSRVSKHSVFARKNYFTLTCQKAIRFRRWIYRLLQKATLILNWKTAAGKPLALPARTLKKMRANHYMKIFMA